MDQLAVTTLHTYPFRYGRTVSDFCFDSAIFHQRRKERLAVPIGFVTL